MTALRSAAPWVALLLLASACGAPAPSSTAEGPTFRIELTPEAEREVAELGLEVPIDGRVFVVVSTSDEREPRFQVDLDGVPFWARDVEDLAGGGSVTIAPGDEGLSGYPFTTLGELPEGEYHVQAFLSVYTTYNRADGHVLKMHHETGEGQNLWRSPGNVHSAVTKLSVRSGASYTLVLDTVIPPIEPLAEGQVLEQGNPPDSRLVKFVKIRSEKLSTFWGKDMYLGANVLLPSGYEENPGTKYPTLYMQGHFPGRRAPFGYSDEPADPQAQGRGRSSAEFSEFWRSGQAPQFVAISIRDANPYYDTAYSVNSANVGPYGDAIHEELIPYLEQQFRLIPEGWARTLAGGSTGGWEAIALQVFYPDYYGGAWGWCPDPLDFSYHQIVNIYEDENAYWTENEWHRIERPNTRRPDGNVTTTMRQENHMENAVGPNTRSGGQWAIWEAVFGPVGEDGYPRPIWDPVTGVIDRTTAEYWRSNYDIHAHLRSNWETLAGKLDGKLHIATGDADTYYLDNAVYLVEDFLRSASPRIEHEIQYGRRKPHCWMGYSPSGSGEDMTYREFVQVLADHWRENAPSGAVLP